MERYASVGSIKPNGHVFQMSFSTLKFPPSLLASAIECEGVARLAGRSLKLEESSDVISLSLGSRGKVMSLSRRFSAYCK